MSGVSTQDLIAILRQHIGQTLTAEVAADICMAATAPSFNPIDLSRFEPEHYGSLVFRAEYMKNVVDEIRPLHLAHWQETELHRHGLPFNPDYPRFIEYERAGRYLLFTARNEQGRMVGNCAIYLHRSTHTQTIVATEDTMFLLPEYRKGRTAIRFFLYGERCAAACGATEGRVSVKHVNRVGLLWQRIGYRPVATEYSKILSEVGQ